MIQRETRTIENELQTIKQAMAEDPHFAWGWHCNVSMAMQDEGVDPTQANLGAARFMKLAFDIDTTECDEWETLDGSDNQPKPPEGYRLATPEDTFRRDAMVFDKDIGDWRKTTNANEFTPGRIYAVAIELKPETPKDIGEAFCKALDIDKRVAVSLAVGRYLRSSDKFNEASREFTASCKSLRMQLGQSARFVCQVDFKHYLVTSDNDGNFDVELIQSI